MQIEGLKKYNHRNRMSLFEGLPKPPRTSAWQRTREWPLHEAAYPTPARHSIS